MRQIVLDTETTGLTPMAGHRIIEIGCVELIDCRLTGNDFHRYLNPDRESDAQALAKHGIASARLADEPRFADIAERFLEYVRGAELIAHNAQFDVRFIDAELARCGPALGCLADHVARIVDTQDVARARFPGPRLSLDRLCARLGINTEHRTLHGALIDAKLLVDAYLALMRQQGSLDLGNPAIGSISETSSTLGQKALANVRVVRATASEREQHARRLAEIEQIAGFRLWPRDNEIDPIDS